MCAIRPADGRYAYMDGYLRILSSAEREKIIYAARQILKTPKKGACFGKNRKKRSEAKKIKETEVNITLENGNTIHLKQTTDYPETDEIVLEVTDASAATVLNIRVPDWVKDPAVKINGEAVDAVTAGSYIAVTVNAGDRIEITYPSELTWVEGDSSQINAGAILQTGQWQHLAVVINGVTASLYLNGEEVGTASVFLFRYRKFTSTNPTALTGKNNSH